MRQRATRNRHSPGGATAGARELPRSPRARSATNVMGTAHVLEAVRRTTRVRAIVDRRAPTRCTRIGSRTSPIVRVRSARRTRSVQRQQGRRGDRHRQLSGELLPVDLRTPGEGRDRPGRQRHRRRLTGRPIVSCRTACARSQPGAAGPPAVPGCRAALAACPGAARRAICNWPNGWSATTASSSRRPGISARIPSGDATVAEVAAADRADLGRRSVASRSPRQSTSPTRPACSGSTRRELAPS